ncbi:MAG TPA: hypothetical protein VFE14_08760 [Micromonosporaceae bacterium]|jgi:hypothetical protein|nr:hypothetical protein [Micromonosporaceae bacterium]
MPDETSILDRARPSRTQMAWAAIGLAVVVVIADIAFSNLQAIYNSEKDFVVGTLFSLAGFCFGKALNRTQEQRALELITTAPTPKVAAALREEMEVRLHSEGVFAQLSVLERNVDAAVNRLSEYYDSQARELQFYRHAPLLRVALDDLDKAAANVVLLRRTLGASTMGPEYVMSPAMRLTLIRIRRDLREAIGRRDQAYEWFAERLSPDTAEDVWDVFAVMTADILKADRSLEALLGEHISFPIEEYLHTINGYLLAACSRAKEFEAVLAEREVGKPTIFDVMVSDLTLAGEAVTQLEHH